MGTPVNCEHMCVADGCVAVVANPVGKEDLHAGRGDGVNTNIGLVCRDHFTKVYDCLWGYGLSNVYNWMEAFKARLNRSSAVAVTESASHLRS